MFVEAIGVPVLLSLLLFSYASMSSSKDVLDLNELPDGRLQLYKMGSGSTEHGWACSWACSWACCWACCWACFWACCWACCWAPAVRCGRLGCAA